jgi:uncharacterized protein YkwD
VKEKITFNKVAVSIFIGLALSLAIYGIYYYTDEKQEPEALNIDQVENNVISKINQERINKGLPTIPKSQHLSAISYQHSKDMSREDYFNHSSDSNSENVYSRYDKFNYDCGKRTAEKIIRIYYNQEHTTTYNNSVVKYKSNQALSNGIYESILSSDYSNELFVENWDEQGIGIYRNGQELYITHNLC